MIAHSVLALLSACLAISPTVAQEQDAASQNAAQTPVPTPAFYHNIQYGFCLRLPADWEGYTITTETWSGAVMNTQKTESGPELLIGNPNWENTWRDIPIMIFTPSQWKLVEANNLSVTAAPIDPAELGRKNYVFTFTQGQWELVEKDRLAVSAVPIGPAELGRNKNYVFALPPRWIEFTDAEGQGDVRAFMSRHPFDASCEPIVYRNTQYAFLFPSAGGLEGIRGGQ